MSVSNPLFFSAWKFTQPRRMRMPKLNAFELPSVWRIADNRKIDYAR